MGIQASPTMDKPYDPRTPSSSAAPPAYSFSALPHEVLSVQHQPSGDVILEVRIPSATTHPEIQEVCACGSARCNPDHNQETPNETLKDLPKEEEQKAMAICLFLTFVLTTAKCKVIHRPGDSQWILALPFAAFVFLTSISVYYEIMQEKGYNCFHRVDKSEPPSCEASESSIDQSQDIERRLGETPSRKRFSKAIHYSPPFIATFAAFAIWLGAEALFWSDYLGFL